MTISTSDPVQGQTSVAPAAIRTKAERLGFDAIGFAPADQAWPAGDHLRDFVSNGRHGDMDWMETTLERRAHPTAMWAEAKSAIVLALSYAPEYDPMLSLEFKELGNISIYARGGDYHTILKKKLKALARWFAETSGEDVKVFVDTAPLMEKPLAQLAGLGWQGKHTNLLSRDLGNWFFIGVVLTTAEIDYETPGQESCGSCRACLEACPTNAFPAPFQLDARRCISYLTIEHKGQIAPEFREPMGNRIYGCDDCLAVCPWNKFAQTAKEQKLFARAELKFPTLDELLRLDDAAFRTVFAGSPIKRTGRDRFVRNVLVAAGNSQDQRLTEPVCALLADASPLVRGMAIWALSRLDKMRFDAEKSDRLPQETDPIVTKEWLIDGS